MADIMQLKKMNLGKNALQSHDYKLVHLVDNKVNK